MKESKLYRMSTFDWILAFSILSVSVGISLSLSAQASHAGTSALVYCDGRLIATYELSSDRIVAVPAAGHEIKLEIRGGRIRIVDADCPRQICEHTGWISRANQRIVCVPNKILIEVKGQPSGAGYDAVSY